ncbi:MAG: trypsin-like serine protease [candidate division Zixibacteria bacterium]|nr:trypsin-like serine protease [candidate division Zixibacteria bacterium]
MKMSCIVVVVFLIFFAASHTQAQISSGGVPPSFSKLALADAPTVVTANVDRLSLLAEDEAEVGKDIPLRFGMPFEVIYNMENSGVWETLADGSHLWRLRIESPEAYSINLVYRHFWMPQGAKLYLYNADHTMILGAFTDANNKEWDQFATGPVRGDVTILEYWEPAGLSQSGIIEIERVIHAYRDLFDRSTLKDAQGYGSSGSCNNNVNCPEGADWQDDKRAVAMILTSGGFRLCTGALINNVREDLTPYFLTAEHCLGGEATWIFMFNYESPGCDNQNGPTWMTVSGCTRRSANSYSDFGLLELSANPPDSYNVYYGGWSRENSASSWSVGIHHPSGDIKKISFDNNPAIDANYGGSSGGSHWKIGAWEDGTTEPGSSGSPLFDQNHRITGQLHGGTASCSSPNSPDYYGKFAKSWDYGSSASSRLHDWLDPDNTGVTTLDGIDPLGITIVADTTYGDVPLDVLFTGSSLLDVIEWKWFFGDGDSALTQSPAHTYDIAGTYDVSLLVVTAEGDRERTKENYIIALADTMKAADTNVVPYQTFEVTIYATNNVSVNRFTIPFEMTGDLDLTYESFSAVGCRTEYFAQTELIASDPWSDRYTIELIASSNGSLPELEPGSGPILKLTFSVSDAITSGQQTTISLAGYSTYTPTFSGSLLTYEPKILSPVVSYLPCCTGLRGNVDGDPSDNVVISDLTYLVSYLFTGGLPPVCYDEADIDGISPINLADLTYLVAYLFTGGPPPPAC